MNDQGPDADFSGWFSLDGLDAATDTPATQIAAFREQLAAGSTLLQQRFDEGVDVTRLIRARAWLVDALLVRAWRLHTGKEGDDLALVAVGGYGRRELMPGSDVDLLLLLPDNDEHRYDSGIESFLTFLWDIGLEVGHSVRSVADCIEQSLADITVATNLMESRLLAGSKALHERMKSSTCAPGVWSSRDFFEVKLAEQQARHRKYHETAYRLEPNIKESPGGLRDIQMIAWVANRHFGTDSLEELVERGFLTAEEFDTLIRGRNHLWKVRFALHIMTGRGEDRLLFDYQRSIAEMLGYENKEHSLGVEAFMKQYYRAVMELSRLNEMLLQLFHEELLFKDSPSEPVVMNRRFQTRNNYLEFTDRNIPANYPYALLEIFLVLEQNPELAGVRADTIRAIRENRHLIDDAFRNDIRARSLFMEIIRQPHGITHELRRMNVYGVLAAYLPAFENIVGLMQYDLFHIYTVDEHILFVVRNLRRFTVPEYAGEFPLCSHVIDTLPKPELLYIAGLFHDIAKGRGGDHSILGETDARDFCQRHDLSDYDTDLVAWLVQNHLVMSSTAQRKDISDPDIVNEFAETVGDTMHLDYLYLLTVADIRATNPEMWNAWKDSLLKQLYHSTRRRLTRGSYDPVERSEQVRKNREAAEQLIGDSVKDHEAIWERMGEEYLLRHLPWQIAHHTRLVAASSDKRVVDIQQIEERGITEIFIYGPSEDFIFSRITAVMAQLGLNIVEAGIHTSSDNMIMDTFHVLEESGEAVSSERRSEEIRNALLAEMSSESPGGWQISRRAPRHYRHFPLKTVISFHEDEAHNRTVMELTTADRPGLLSLVGRVFSECNVVLANARITTLGSRVEDVYNITDADNRPLTDSEQLACIENRLREYLDPESSG